MLWKAWSTGGKKLFIISLPLRAEYSGDSKLKQKKMQKAELGLDTYISLFMKKNALALLCSSVLLGEN